MSSNAPSASTLSSYGVVVHCTLNKGTTGKSKRVMTPESARVEFVVSKGRFVSNVLQGAVSLDHPYVQ
jgi:hypothetical protein